MGFTVHVDVSGVFEEVDPVRYVLTCASVIFKVVDWLDCIASSNLNIADDDSILIVRV